MTSAFRAGAIGAVTTNLLHEITRRLVPDAPRVDLLGMQALAKIVSTQTSPPTGRTLYATTLAADLASNAAYFALIGLLPRRAAPLNGLLTGALAGIGAVLLPGPLKLSEVTTARTTTTKLLTIGLYAAGGLATGFALRA